MLSPFGLYGPEGTGNAFRVRYHSVAVNGDGNAVVVGEAVETLHDTPPISSTDAVFAEYDTAGTYVDTHRIAAETAVWPQTYGYCAAVSPTTGTVYAAGRSVQGTVDTGFIATLP